MIRVSHLNKTYGRGKNRGGQVLYDVSFTLPDTGFVCIVGPSGCGKTTLLNAIGGLDTFDGGRVSTDSLENLRCGSRGTEWERNRSFGYIFQNYYLLPEHSVAYNVYLGLHSLELSDQERRKRVKEALAAVDMARYARRKVGELSGGQQQRVAIARALVKRPKVIFADEPTGNLDQANTVNICSLLRRISKKSLVVMVTHEEQTARFFADRILTIADGRLTGDTGDWQRNGLSTGGDTLYTGEYAQSEMETPELSVRLLREEGAAPAKLTIAVLKDQIVIKLADSRSLRFGGPGDAPVLAEGTRPVLRLEDLDNSPEDSFLDAPVLCGRPGGGLGLSMLAKEARRLAGEKGIRRTGARLFLVVLTILSLLTLGDYQYVASMDPEEFITTDSHMLEIQLERGPSLGAATVGIQGAIQDYVAYLADSGLDFDFIPPVPIRAECTLELYWQLGSVSEALSKFSYVPLQYLDESLLICGRMPDSPEEIVVDRWVLETMLKKDGIVQSGISDVTYFLGRQLLYSKKNYSPTIVGISDSGEPAVYMAPSAIASIGSAGTELICLSELKALLPGAYEELTLEQDECILVLNNAGPKYADYVGMAYKTNSQRNYTTAAVIEETGTYATMVIADEALEKQIQSMMSTRFYLYCQDKEAVKDFLAQPLPEEMDGCLQIKVIDHYAEDWTQKLAQTHAKVDARTIVTATVMVLSMVMLYLMQRAQVWERMEMIAVYRLLGIPGQKLTAIFTLECVRTFLFTAFPAALVTWGTVAVLSALPSQKVPLLLTWQTAAAGTVALAMFYLLVSLLPLCLLLRQPPARLAARFDF